MRGHVSVFKAILGHNHVAEKALLERNPFQLVGHRLIAVFVLVEVIHVVVGQGAVIHRFTGKAVGAFFLLHQVHSPIDGHVVGIGTQKVFHSVGHHREIKHVVVVANGIDEVQMLVGVVGGEAHGEHDAVVFAHGHIAAREGLSVNERLKIELRSVHNTVVGEKRKVEQRGFRVERNQRQRVVGLVVFQLDLFQEAALVAECESLQLVLDSEGLLGALGGASKNTVFVAQHIGFLLRQRRRVHNGDSGRIVQLCQGCGLLRLFECAERVQGHFFHADAANGVLNALLFSNLLFRRGHEIHPTKEDGCDEDKTN